MFLAKAEYFTERGSGLATKAFFSGVGQIPIDPKLRIRPGVIFGKPLEFSRFYGKESDRAVLRTVTNEIMREIQQLSGQEYVDIYAKQAKDELRDPAEESDLR